MPASLVAIDSITTTQGNLDPCPYVRMILSALCFIVKLHLPLASLLNHPTVDHVVVNFSSRAESSTEPGARCRVMHDNGRASISPGQQWAPPLDGRNTAPGCGGQLHGARETDRRQGAYKDYIGVRRITKVNSGTAQPCGDIRVDCKVRHATRRSGTVFCKM